MEIKYSEIKYSEIKKVFEMWKEDFNKNPENYGKNSIEDNDYAEGAANKFIELFQTLKEEEEI